MDSVKEIAYLPLDDVIPNRFQPREIFDEEALRELSASIKEHGVIQPIIVRQIDNKYEIIAGERRYKAASLAGLTTIPAIVRNLDDKESSKVALIENLQRRDLNPLEEARTYEKIQALDPNLTQDAMAKSMGKSQAVIANKLRLLSLPEEVQEAILKDQISERHARSLLTLKDNRSQIEMLNKIRNERLTVRELDVEIKKVLGREVDSNSELETILDKQVVSDSRSLAEMLEGNKSASTQVDIDGINDSANNDFLSPRYQAIERNQNKELKLDTFDEDDDEEEIEIPSTPQKEILPLKKEPLDKEKEEEDELLLEDEENNLPKLNENLNTIDELLNPPVVEAQKVEELEENNSNSYIQERPRYRGFKGLIDIIRNTVSSMKDSGYIVETEEIDFDENYQIIIKVDKKSIKKTEI